MRDQVEGRSLKDGTLTSEYADERTDTPYRSRSDHNHDMGVLLIIAMVCVPFLVVAGIVVALA